MKKEVKIGIFAVVMILCLWAGIRFLSGIDIFSRNATYYAVYDQINGVQEASSVMCRGVKIGSVTDVMFNPSQRNEVVLKLSIQSKYHIPQNSVAKIFSSSLMGAKAIDIVYGDGDKYLSKGDTIRTESETDLMAVASSELEFFKQEFSKTVLSLTTTLDGFSTIMNDNRSNINGTLSNINSITGELNSSLGSDGGDLKVALDNISKFAAALGRNAKKIDGVITNLDDVSQQLSDAQIDKLAADLRVSIDGINRMIAAINSNEGTAGKLINDPALYNSLSEASANLAYLLQDVQQNPKRYVHFSVFGGSSKKAKEAKPTTAQK